MHSWTIWVHWINRNTETYIFWLLFQSLFNKPYLHTKITSIISACLIIRTRMEQKSLSSPGVKRQHWVIGCFILQLRLVIRFKLTHFSGINYYSDTQQLFFRQWIYTQTDPIVTHYKLWKIMLQSYLDDTNYVNPVNVKFYLIFPSNFDLHSFSNKKSCWTQMCCKCLSFTKKGAKTLEENCINFIVYAEVTLWWLVISGTYIVYFT